MEGILKGTGQWLIEKPEFEEWELSEDSGILWLHGIREFDRSII
jgi:hypothetical protein